MDRKEFLLKIAGSMLLVIPAVSLIGCGDSDDDDPPTNGGQEKDCLKNGTQNTIGSNHGHSLQVSKDDVESGIEKQYAIGGSSGHDHNVIISSDNFSKLKSNQQIQVSSTNNSGHSHPITVSCA